MRVSVDSENKRITIEMQTSAGIATTELTYTEACGFQDDFGAATRELGAVILEGAPVHLTPGDKAARVADETTNTWMETKESFVALQTMMAKGTREMILLHAKALWADVHMLIIKLKERVT